MELSSKHSSSIPGYSDDTFTSFSEETCREYDNDPFVSYYSGEDSNWPAGSDLSESTRQSPSQNNEALPKTEFLDPTAAGEYLTSKWISLLTSNRTTAVVARPAVEPANMPTRTAEVPAEELGALQSFCATRIHWLSRPLSSAPPRRKKRNGPRHGRPSEAPLGCDRNCVVPNQLADRLHLKNINAAVKQLAEIEMHQPSQCPHCMKKRAELARSAFLRRRKTLLDEVLLQEKLEDYMYTRDSLTLIGEIHQTLPKLSEDPRNIWQKLNEGALKA